MQAQPKTHPNRENELLNIRDSVNGIASNLKAELLKYSITDRYNCNVHTL